MPRPNRGTSEKSKDFMGSMKKLLKNLKPWRVLLTLGLVLAFISAILSLVAPDHLSNLTDTITSGIKPNISENTIKDIMSNPNISYEDKMSFQVTLSSMNDSSDTTELLKKIDELPSSIYDIIKPSVDMAKVKSIVTFLTILYLLSAIFSYIESVSMTTVSNNFAKNLRSRISVKINKLPLKYFDTHETGDVLSRVTNDVDTIAQNLNQSLATLISATTLFVGSIIMMFATNWIMAITAIISSLIGFAFMFIILMKSQKYFMKRQKELGELNGHIEEIYSGQSIVRAYNNEENVKEEFNKLNEALKVSNQKSQFLS